MSSQILLEDFGQKVDLTRRIREVLLNYPEGTTVLKELLQNADDANATKLSLCLDKRRHNSQSLLSPSLSTWQGPALLSYNDAVFTERDFLSISRIGGSVKQALSSKTGRFGVGFNSVYHLTDLPSFVSGNYVVLFDPQGIYLPNVNSSNPGKRIDYVASSIMSVYKDQFEPYVCFGCDMVRPFNGTLFRFPLRNSEIAKHSKLSRQAYEEKDVVLMFEQLFQEGVSTLLFLKSVVSVEMYVWDNGELAPRKLFSVCVNDVSESVIWHRKAILRMAKKGLEGGEEDENGGVDGYTAEFLSEEVLGSEVKKRVDRYYIVQAMARPSSRIVKFAATASKEYDIHLLPWGSVAACLSDGSFSNQNDDSKPGRAFCFLPLPVKTGLNVHVNGYFEVSSNRRGIWYGADMDRSGKIRSLWNRLLLEDVVAPIFVSLMLGSRELLGSTDSYYSLWPTGLFEEPWNILVEQVYRKIGNAPVLHSGIEGGKWVTPVQAFLHDQDFSKSKELGEALLQLGMPIVHLPNMLFNMFLKYASGFQQNVVTPDTVRQFLRECQTLSTLSKSCKLALLEYCLEDLIDDDVGTHASNLPLVPLANGDFGLLCEGSKGPSYFICNELEYKLLQQVHDKVIDHDIPLNMLNRLSAVAESSKANLSVFNIQHFIRLFPAFVPNDWRYKDKVPWNPKSYHNHPTSSWFELFWRYLRNQCEKLSLFSDWPILPSTSGHLYRPSRQSKLIRADTLAISIQHILDKICCKILDPRYGVEHEDLSHYVYDANCAGVLESIADVISSNGGTIQAVFHSLNAEERDDLRSFVFDPKWYIGGTLDISCIRNCKMLPIFRVHGGGLGQDFSFSDLENPEKFLPPPDVLEIFLGGEFILCPSNSEEEILLRYYGIERMGKACFYRNHVFNHIKVMNTEVRESVMLSVLQNLPQLCLEDASFKESLKNLEFVPTLAGALKCPKVLYDPRNEELCALLEDSDCFPSGAFQDSNILDMLHGLGLRKFVSPETIIESARQVEGLMHADPKKAHSRGKVLLSYLEVNAMKWIPDQLSDNQGTLDRLFSRASTAFRPRHLKSDLEKFWNDLRMICWCPVMVCAPFQTLPWPVVSSTVAPPKLVRLKTDIWLVSASMRILDGECSSTALSYNLGWLSAPGGSAIAAQLLELGKNNEIVSDQVLRQELALAMPRIYSIMLNLLGSDEMDIVKAVLEGSRWIWVGDGFATTDEVVLDGPLHLAPYIRVIPVDLAAFKELFLELDVREIFKHSDYANILSKMAIRKGSLPLDVHEIRAAILIVQHLAEAQFHDRQVKIFLPDVSGRLFPASNLVYNDAPWLLGSNDLDDSFIGAPSMSLNARKTVHKFVHGNISNEVAEKLGVCSLRRILLAESADSMNLSLSGAAEAFGQHEALTTRLKHILEMYADGPGILFELVQNAEDAGASDVAFLLDKTQYGTSSVLSPEMADWQGPALYCFNDSVFSPQDLYAISRIGQESKLEKPFAIGRFGLGFNCVYHFTDIPSFVSGENIVIFDPHASNLPGISPSHPGLRIKYAGRKILEQFPDQFSPFLQFGCDMQHQFAGTLFRFPLRNPTTALRSQIKKEGYATEDVVSLFSSFSAVVSEALLFLHNVKTISLYIKEGNGNEMQLLHRVHRTCIMEPEMESASLGDTFSLVNRSKYSGLDKNQLLKQLSKSVGRDLPCKCQKIVVTEEKQFDHVSHCWITGECLGSGQAGKSAAVENNKSHKSIPWACVAAYVHSIKIDEKTRDLLNVEVASSSNLFQVSTSSTLNRKNFEGRAFCFLPLPINTGLPTHINSYFELSSNRRDIWFGNDMAGGGKKRSDWNIYILEDVAAPAYGRLLEKIALDIGPCDLLFSFWPTSVGLEPWASMVRKLYVYVAEFSLRVLYTRAREGQWISTKQALFPDFTFYKVDELVEALSDAGLPLVMVSKPIVERFVEACPTLNLLTPQLLRALLIRRKREFKDRSAMILTLEYCLLDIKAPIRADNLYGLALLPLANGSFTTFEENGAGERVYVAQGDEYGLLKDYLAHQLVDCNVPEVVYGKICDITASGKSNISFLSCSLLEKLLLKILPAEWQLSEKVIWTPGYEGQPSLEWMKLLWAYLKSSCDDLSMFSKWPILPVGDCYLMRLVPNSNVIKDDGWSENMSSLLLKVGCQFLRQDFTVEHPQLEDFVQPPTAAGLLNAFLAIAATPDNIHGLFCDASDAEMHELRSFVLQSKWFSEEQMSDTHIDVIKHLPMFESYGGRKLVSLSKSTKRLKPNGIREDLLNNEFVRAESERERDILRRYLDIREPTKVEFYKAYVLNRLSEFLSEPEALSAILLDIKLLVEDDISIKSALSVTPFVLAANGSWQQPSRLYDPRISELRNVLHREAFFPSEKFSDPEILETLVSLGLKRTLGFTGFLDCARSVSMLHDSGDLEAVSHGRRFLSCLNSLAMKLSSDEVQAKGNDSHVTLLSENDGIGFNGATSTDEDKDDSKEGLNMEYHLGELFDDKPEEEFWSEMRQISWCPVCADPPLEGLPWLNSDLKVASPSTVRPISQMWLVSGTMYILDGECNSTYLQNKLGWMDCPKVEVLTRQLIGISKSYDQIKIKSSSLKHDFDTALQKGIPLIYSKLQDYIGSDDFMVLKSALDGSSWVWICDGFVSPCALAFDSPVKFSPYLYVVPSELSEFRELLLELGVRLSFNIWDYLRVLQCLQNDVHGLPLTNEQLCFVCCVLEAVLDCCLENSSYEALNVPVLIPDSSGVLMGAGDLVYNDAPWIETSALGDNHFVHPSISNDLADRLGVKSLRCLSLVDDDMTKDLPCMDFAKVNELLALYGSNDLLLFDLLELADCCKAKRLHLILDKREHSRRSLLQHNLGDFQGPALVAILEGVSLNREEVSSLQFLPPWRLRDDTLNYGLGLLSCYFLCDLLSIVSGGYFYMFDPQGLALGVPSSHRPAAKMFSLIGTNLTERFGDQFKPMLISENMTWSSMDSTIIRMPLSSECLKDGLELGLNSVKQIFEKFMEHASRVLLFLKSVLQVSISTWDEGATKASLDYSVSVDLKSASLRNPFPEKKWRKFQIARLFASSNAAVKLHVIDVNLYHGATRVVDQWLVALSLGSGQTRNMALDRRYLAYNLTPVAGVAAHISRDGHPVDVSPKSSIMSPLPLSGSVNLPVTVFGCFLVRHNGCRSLFKHHGGEILVEPRVNAADQLIEEWNVELMACVRDSYVEMMVEILKITRDPSSSTVESGVGRLAALSMKGYSDPIYSFWPRSNQFGSEVLKKDWECVIKQVVRPFYARIADLPVWQLYSGSLVKCNEGMFLSQPGNGVGDNLLPATVCSFVKEHYPVFSVPWELIAEIQAVGVKVREIKPKMVRDLLRASSTSFVLRSVDTFVDVLEYCLSDIDFPGISNFNGDDILTDPITSNTEHRSADEGGSNSSALRPNAHSFRSSSSQSSASSGDALEMMTSLGKALFDFGRVVVEDIGRAGGPLNERNSISQSRSRSGDLRVQWIASELKGLPCPTATNHLVRLGVTELWFGNKDQQSLMISLAAKFIHPKVLDRSILSDIFSKSEIQTLLKVKSFSLPLLANHMRLLFHESWVNHVLSSTMVPWFSWESRSNFGSEGGPSQDWIRLFWKCWDGSSEELSLFSNWPLIPAFLGRPILCRVKERHLIFIPPLIDSASGSTSVDSIDTGSDGTRLSVDFNPEAESVQPNISAFEETKNRYPWLLSLLNQWNIPIFDAEFLSCAASCDCLPRPGRSLGQLIASKLVAAKHAGYLPELSSFSCANKDQIFTLFANDFYHNGATYGSEELEVLKYLPIYKTVTGSYTQLHGQDQCMIFSNSFFKPFDEHCLSYSTDSIEFSLLRALGVPELHDKQILIRFGLPGFEEKAQSEQEDILIYLYTNWQDLQKDSFLLEILKETKFVKSADESSTHLFKSKDLFDPRDALLTSVFSDEKKRFPGERFSLEGWLRILRKIGLKSTAEADVILECAKKVEFLGSECMKCDGEFDDFEINLKSTSRQVSMEIWALAGAVVEAVFSNFAVLYGNNFCNLFGKIACVPAELGFPNSGGKRVLTSYSEAILLKDWPLAWTCSPILSRQNVVPPEYSWTSLHLRSPPPFPKVLKHLQVTGRNGGEDTLAHWPTGLMTVDEASCEVLKYLEKVWGSLSSSDIEELRKVAFLPAANGTRLVMANFLFVRLTRNLSPFAFELPSLYLPNTKVLKELGLQEMLSVAAANDLLLNLQKSCGYQRLNPNELRAVMEILHFLCDINTGEIMSHRVDWKSDLIVPDDGCRLVHAKLCVYIDSYGSRYVKFIDTSRLRFVHPELPERICTVLEITKLSDVVVEELDEEEHLQTLDCIGSVQLGLIREKLLSGSFQRAVRVLVNGMASYVPTIGNLDSENMQTSLELVAENLKFVRFLHTRFMLMPKYVDITLVTKDSIVPGWELGSKHRSLYFLNQSRTSIFVAEPPSFIPILDTIATVVSQVLGSPVPLPLQSLFLCPEGFETSAHSILRLSSDKREIESTNNKIVGKEILPADALRVQLHPLRPFYKGEIVAWRSQNGEKLKYGIVPEDVKPSAGQALYRLKVETAPGSVEPLLSSQVFSFKSMSAENEVSSATLPGDAGTAVYKGANTELAESSARGKTKSPQASKELRYGRVSAAELVQAVQEMLSAAGINMDVEKQSLLKTTITLQEQLKESQVAFLVEQEKADSAAKEAETAKAAWVCRVCLTNEVDTTIVPCGHVLCRRCSSAVSRCPFCRLQVTKTIKIFRP